MYAGMLVGRIPKTGPLGQKYICHFEGKGGVMIFPRSGASASRWITVLLLEIGEKGGKPCFRVQEGVSFWMY